MRRRAVLFGAASALGAGPAFAQQGLMRGLSDLATQAVRAATPGSPQPAPPRQAPPPGTLGRQDLAPMGYSLQFLPVRERLDVGDYSTAVGLLRPAAAAQSPAKGKSAEPASPFGADAFLDNAERGLIAFEAGDLVEANTLLTRASAASDIKPVSSADNKSGDRMRSAAAQIGSVVRRGTAVALGQGELAPYTRRDHEAILDLNYLSLTYLLQGDRRCYNVTRRCISEQKLLKAKFDSGIADYRSRYAAQKQKGEAAATGPGSLAELETEITAYDGVANLVPNAYVNPLGDYLAGVIQEIVAREEVSLRDNARISYETAAALSGRSPQMQAAAKAMARQKFPPNERVIHVVVAEGFAPSRQVLTYGFNWNDTPVLARLPKFVPIASAVSGMEIRVGQQRTPLDAIGNFEALVMRDQKDWMPATLLNAALVSAASYAQAKAAARFGQMGTAVIGLKRDAERPDTRSWSSLPRRFHVARVTLPAGARTVELVSTDSGGRRLFSAVLGVDQTKPQTFVYARATDRGLTVQSTRPLWIDGRLEET